MSLAYVPRDEPERRASTLANLEAEQALLGAILYDNAAAERLPEGLKGAHFAEPFHGWLYDQILALTEGGKLAEPILVDEKARGIPAYQELGGIRYLADLIDRAGPASTISHFADIVLDLALRRTLVRVAEDAADAAKTDHEASARDIIETAEQDLFSLAETKSSGGFRTFADNLAGALDMAAKAYERDGGISGLPTGLIDLDSKLGGLQPSDLVIIAARPSMGKTALATSIAFHLASRYAYEQLPDGSKRTSTGTELRHAPNAKGAEGHLNLIPATRKLLQAAGVPYVIENVPDVARAGHLIDPVMLNGFMFGLGCTTSAGVRFHLERERWFETSWGLRTRTGWTRQTPVVGVYGGHVRNRSAEHGGRGTVDFPGEDRPALAREAMQMRWATMNGMSEAIPPAFTRYVGMQFLEQRERLAA